MACIPPNPRRVGYIDPIHEPLDMGLHIHQQGGMMEPYPAPATAVQQSSMDAMMNLKAYSNQ